MESLKMQGNAAADFVRQEFDEAWRNADMGALRVQDF